MHYYIYNTADIVDATEMTIVTEWREIRCWMANPGVGETTPMCAEIFIQKEYNPNPHPTLALALTLTRL